MASRYWVGGTNTWDTTAGTKWATTSGGTGGAAVPTNADDVFFDANSTGTCTITASTTVACQSLDLTNSGAVLAQGVASSLTIGGAAPGPGNAALTLTTGKYTWSSNASILFVSTSATQQTITTNGVTVPNIVFNGVGGSWKIIGNITCNNTGSVSFYAGTIDWNGAAGNWGAWQRIGTATCNLTLGAADITMLVTGSWLFSVSTNLTVSAASATLRFAGTTQSFQGGAYTYGTIIVTSSIACGVSLSTGSLANLTYTPGAVVTSSLQFGSNVSITGTFTATGNSVINRAYVATSIAGNGVTITASAVSFSNVDFMDITASGAATPWTGTSLGDCQGNSNIAFTTATSRYAVVAGNWSSPATWSTISGGSAGASAPLPQDSVYLDTNSGAGTYVANIPRLGKNLDCSGFSQTLNLSSIANVLYGNLTFSGSMTLIQSQQLTFAGRNNQTVRSNGISVGSNITIDAVNGSYSFSDDFSCSITGATFKNISGSLNDNGNTITFGRLDFSAANIRTVTLTGTWNMTAPSPASNILCAFTTAGLTLNATAATFVVASASTTTRYFYGSGLSIGTLTYTVAGSTGTLILPDSTTYGTINFSDTSNARTLSILSGKTITILNAFNVNGTAGKPMTINAVTPGSLATISKASGVISCDYLSLQDSKVTGGATWYAGAHSSSVSNTSGWIFQKLAASGGGNWTSGSTWVGGVAPTASDVAVLDAASGDVSIDSGGAVARAIDCTAYSGTLSHLANATLALGDATIGSNSSALAFSSTMTYNLVGGASSVISFVSTNTAVQTITTAGKTLGSWTVSGSGSNYQLADVNSTTASSIVSLLSGTLNTYNQVCNWGNFSSTGTLVRTLTLGSSTVTLASAGNPWTVISSPNITLNANTSTLIFTTLAAFNINTGACTYNNITVTHASSTVYLDPCTITGTLSVTGGTSALSRFCTGGTVTISGSIVMAGNSVTNRLLVNSNVLGSQRTYALGTTGTVSSLSNVDFSDVAFTGSHTPATGTSLGDAQGNSGITFDTPATQTWQGTAGGNWSDVTKWTSRVPLPQDDVVIASVFTGSPTISGDMPRLGKSITFSGSSGTLTFTPSTNTSIYGSLTLNSNLASNVGNGNTMTFAGRGSYTITSAGKTFAGAPFLAAPNGTYTLQDDYASSIGSGWQITNGTFISNNCNITCGLFILSSGATATLGTSTITLNNSTLNAAPVNISSSSIFSGANATFVVSGAWNSSRTFGGGSKTFGALTYNVANSPGALIISGGNTFNNLTFGPGTIVTMPSSTTTTVTGTFSATGASTGSLYLPGTAGNYVSVPNSAALQITGDIDIIAYINPKTWAVASDYQTILSKRANGGSAAEYAFRLYTGTKYLDFYWFENGTGKDVTSNVAVPFVDGQAGWVRVTRSNSGGPGGVFLVYFYTSTDGTTWTQLGVVQTGTAAAAPTLTTNDVLIGAIDTNTSSQLYQGMVNRVIVKNGIGGTTQLDVNFTAKPMMANSFTESSTNAATVTINGTAAQAGDGRIILNASTAASAATLSKPYGMVNTDYLAIQDSTAGGGATWYAGSHSTNVSNNSGWIFNAPPAGRGGFLPYFS